jgi:protoporphyrinogen oxidase
MHAAPERSAETPVAILGAGLTGLSAAWTLGERGVDYRIFERLDRVGGHAVTAEEDGYRFDRTGHLLHLRHPRWKERVLGWVPDCSNVVRKSRVFSHGVYTRYPFQANTFGLPADVAHECVLGFVRAAMSPPQREPQNFEEFCLQHFGAGISRHFMLPYNERLWGVPAREITSAWCQRFVPLPALEDVLEGAFGLNDRELGYNANFLYPRHGIGELPQAIARQVRPVELGRTPTGIDFERRELHFESEIVPYQSLISTIPLPVLVGLLRNAPPEVTAAASELRSTHLDYLDVALARPCGQDLHWVYVPEYKYPFYRVGCYSHFSAAMAPPGKASLYVELADRGAKTLDGVLPGVTDGLVELGLIERAGDIAFARLRRIDYAYVIFDHRYFPALEVIKPFLASAGIVAAGRYGDWNYSSMEDALAFGEDAALGVLERLDG